MLRTEFGEKLVLIKANNTLTKDVNQNTDLSEPAVYWKLSGIDRVNIFEIERNKNLASLARGSSYNGYYLEGNVSLLDEDQEYLIEINFLGKETLKLIGTTKLLKTIQDIRQLNEKAVYTDEVHPKLKEKVQKLNTANLRASNVMVLMVFAGLFLILSFFASYIAQLTGHELSFKAQVIVESLGFVCGFIAIFIGLKSTFWIKTPTNKEAT